MHKIFSSSLNRILSVLNRSSFVFRINNYHKRGVHHHIPPQTLVIQTFVVHYPRYRHVNIEIYHLFETSLLVQQFFLHMVRVGRF